MLALIKLALSSGQKTGRLPSPEVVSEPYENQASVSNERSPAGNLAERKYYADPYSVLSVRKPMNTMDSRISSSRRPTESVLTGGRPIRKPTSRSSSRSRGLGAQVSIPLLDFVNDILRFGRGLVRQKGNPLREGITLDAAGRVDHTDRKASEQMSYRMEGDETNDEESSRWCANCAVINVELNRLLMWKLDLAQRQLIPALKEKSPVYSVLCESIMGIAELLKSCRCFLLIILLLRSAQAKLIEVTNTQILSSCPDPNLQSQYKKMENTLEYFRSQPSSTSVVEQPSANTRSRKSAVEGTQEGSALTMLRSDINRLVFLVHTMVEICKKERPQVTPSRESTAISSR